MSARARPRAYLALAAASLLAVAPIQDLVNEVRAGYVPAALATSMPPTQVMGLTLGGFRGLAVDMLWMRAIRLQQERRFYETALLCKLILDLQPRFSAIWAFQAWNMAYNISLETDEAAESWKWVRKGLVLLEHPKSGGIVRNDRSYDVHQELAWFYFDKCARTQTHKHAPYYQKRLTDTPAWRWQRFPGAGAGGLLVTDGPLRLRFRVYARKVRAGEPIPLGGALGRSAGPTGLMYFILAGSAAGEAPRLTVRLSGGALAEPERYRPGRLGIGAPIYTDRPGYRIARAPAALLGATMIATPLSEAWESGEDRLHVETDQDGWIGVAFVSDPDLAIKKALHFFQRADTMPDRHHVNAARMVGHCYVALGLFAEAEKHWQNLIANPRRPGEDTVLTAYGNFLRDLLVYYEERKKAEDRDKTYAKLVRYFPGLKNMTVDELIRIELENRRLLRPESP